MTRGVSMILVTDASVAFKWVVVEEDFEKARQLLSGGHDLHVPRLLGAELGNALWSKVRSGILATDEAPVLLESVLGMTLNWANDEVLAADALRFAGDLNHPIYDCIYLALAHHVDGILVTADDRFAGKVVGTEHAGRVVMLADFAAA